MILATVKVADVDRFLSMFSAKGAEIRKEFGSKGSQLFRDPSDPTRVWVAFDWEAEDFERFTADPEAASIFQEAGIQGRPLKAEPAGKYDA